MTRIFFHFMFFLVRLVRSSYYHVMFHILTGQKRDVIDLKLLWPVNMINNNPKLSLSPVNVRSFQKTYVGIFLELLISNAFGVERL